MPGDVVHKFWDLKQTGLAAEVIGLKTGWSTAAMRWPAYKYGGARMSCRGDFGQKN